MTLPIRGPYVLLNGPGNAPVRGEGSTDRERGGYLVIGAGRDGVIDRCCHAEFVLAELVILSQYFYLGFNLLRLIYTPRVELRSVLERLYASRYIRQLTARLAFLP